MNDLLIWVGIGFCITQSATLSGLNLAVFSLSRLRLEAAAESGDVDATKVLNLRREANFTLVTILWGNVAINVLLTLLADSVMVGIAAFFFSTVVITFVGEIIPQAFFSRYALPVAARLSPLLRFYQIILWPVARPVGKLLDVIIGHEVIPWFQEEELSDVLRQHARKATTEISRLEAIGAINFLALDDLYVKEEGEIIDSRSIINLPIKEGYPLFPEFERDIEDPFIQKVASSGKKWVIFTDGEGDPRFVVDSHFFLRKVLFGREEFNPKELCHRPLVVRDPNLPLGQVLSKLTVRPEKPGDDVVDQDLIILWSPVERRIITGSDILGRLLRGITRSVSFPGTIKYPVPGKRDREDNKD
ncbi:MAG: DUF21 domain-containing protein [Candidatus Syntrophonatronum acetioxidans]|uniref:DUF21 domain-containing protein n=1 Tax=Candidatus Syntrophonatronum acetioxidans TaxID=1795816 RepID=A0A424YGS8_9FIRM|nr:MAG: DUF21 domain-containing protein [Candidatus Syntrophonatronum acetioxidans]